MAARYVLSRTSTGGGFYFVLKAANGQAILTSEIYIAKQSAQAGIESVRVHSPHDQYYVRKTAGNGEPMFNLRANNGQVIGTSETYTTTASRETGIQSVKVNGPTAPVDDLT